MAWLRTLSSEFWEGGGGGGGGGGEARMGEREGGERGARDGGCRRRRGCTVSPAAVSSLPRLYRLSASPAEKRRSGGAWDEAGP